MIATRRTFQPASAQTAVVARPHELSIDVVLTESVAVLGVGGHLTGADSQHLRRTLDQLIFEGSREFTVHLDTSEPPDSTCLQVLREARSRLLTLGGELIVTSMVADTLTLLAMVGLAEVTV